jgi:hypothetical protein
MSGRRLVWVLAVVLAVPLLDDAQARRPRARLSASVDGKRFKAWKRGLTGIYSTASFSAGGSTKPRRGMIRTLQVACAGVDIKTVTLPFAPTLCTGIYQENNIRTGGLKNWSALGIELTADSFDGSRMVGTFRGVIGPSTSNPTEPPVTVEGGTFTVYVVDTGV